MARRKTPLKQSSTKKEVFKFYSWDIDDPVFNKRYTNLKSTAKDVWHTILDNISPGASLESKKTSRLGALQPKCVALAKKKLGEKFKGQAAEDLLLGDGKGLIEHIVSAAQREYWTSGAGKKRIRIWREKVKGTMGGKASVVTNHNSADHHIVDCQGSSGSSSYLKSSTIFGKADEEPEMQGLEMQGSHASPIKYTKAAQAKPLLPQYPPGQGKASLLTPKRSIDSSAADSPVSLGKRYFVIPNGGPPPPPPPAPQASSPQTHLPSMSRDHGSSTAGDVWEPVPSLASYPDSGGHAPDWISNWLSEIPSFDSHSHNDDVQSPQDPTTDQHIADVDEITRVLDPVLVEDYDLDDVLPTLLEVGIDIDFNIDWSFYPSC